VNQLSPKRIILHCGLHKTGSTYIQRNLQGNRKALIQLGILYVGPTTFKNHFKYLWRHIEFGHKKKPPTGLEEQTLNALTDLAGGHNEKIDIILISFESLFGTLSKGLIDGTFHKKSKQESKPGLYRYALSRIKRLINCLERALSTKDIQWTILFATRERDAFIHSCHTQLLKEGNLMTETTFEQLRESNKFIFSEEVRLKDKLNQLKDKRNVKITAFSYDKNSNKDKPSTYLWNVINIALPDLSEKIKTTIEANTDNLNINKQINPSLSDRGLEIADQARPLFDKREWKLFRKFLEKNFSNNN
jgi:hypothetical protein